jgi:hypothetical protein
MSAPSAASAASAAAGSSASPRLPPAGVLLRAAQIAVSDDRPIMLDYWPDSLDKKCSIGVREDTKLLVKSDQEYTSPIENIYKIEGCYIVLTENSLYVVHAEIPVRKIVTPTLALSS